MHLKYVMLGNRGVLTVGGADRDEFLQGLISNDIDRVAADRAIWAAYLTPQGKYLHDFFVTKFDGVNVRALKPTETAQIAGRAGPSPPHPRQTPPPPPWVVAPDW